MRFPTDAAQCIIKQRLSDHQADQSRIMFSDEYLAADKKLSIQKY